jgi:hypothetical protein
MLRTALLVLLAALLAGGAMGQTQPPSPRAGQAGKPPQTIADPIQQHPAADERGTEQNPVIVRSIKSKEDAAQDAQDRQAKTSADWWMLVFSGAVAVGAFLQVGTFIVMISTSRRQLSAYVLPDGGSIRLITAPWGDQKEERIFIEGFVAIKNFGVTPAKKFGAWVAIDVVHLSQPPFDRKSVALDESILAPTEVRNMPVHHGPITDDDLIAIRNGVKRIFVWGEVVFRDVFGRKRYGRYYFFNGSEIAGKGWPLQAAKPHEAN